MKIGIIFALKEELNELLKILTLKKETKKYDLTFYECTLDNKEIILVESGMGKVNSARAAQVLIDIMNVNYILNVGVAGSLDSNLKVCDIVVGEKLVQYDYDVEPLGYKKSEIPGIGVYINSDEYLLKLSKDIETETNTYFGIIASGDKFITDEEMSKKIASEYNAICCEMEGAAISQVCYLSKVPFIVIRAISDSINGNNELSFEEFLSISSKKVCDFVHKLLVKIG